MDNKTITPVEYLVINRKACTIISDLYVDIKQADYTLSAVENIYELQRDDFYVLMRHLLKKDVVTFLSDFKDDTKYNEIYLIPSVINTSELPFYESRKRSLFTHAERFEQTLETVKSCSPCFLLEGSKLTISQMRKLVEAGVTKIILCCEGVTDSLANRSKNKSAFELYIFKEIFPKISANFYIKLGGRYKIFNKEASDKIKDADLATFRVVKGYAPGQQVVECIHYCIPLKLRDTFVEIFEEFLKYFNHTPEQCIENLFSHKLFLNKHLWKEASFLGIIGKDAMLGREYML